MTAVVDAHETGHGYFARTTLVTSTHHDASVSGVRTTLNIDDEILETARSLASERNVSVGSVVSELARRGLRQRTPSPARRNGFPLFAVSRDSTPLTLDRVKRHEDER